jgi:hypothetical protein
MALHRSITLLPFKTSPASTAMELVRPSSPALEAAYVTVPVTPFNANNEETLMMHFDTGGELLLLTASLLLLFFFLKRARIHALSMARQVYIEPSRFVLSVSEMLSAGVLESKFGMDIPAEFIRISTFAWLLI